MSEKKFEEAMLELESIVKKLEAGSADLDESIELYKKGLDLYQFCYKKLQEAEKIIIKTDEGE